jgi:HEAT repeat protein
MLACGQKHVPAVPQRLEAALAATGEQRRALFEGLLRDSDSRLQSAAVEELKTIGSVQSIEPLVNTLRTPNLFLRTASHRALMRLGEPGRMLRYRRSCWKRS